MTAFVGQPKEGLGYVDYLREQGVAVHILNMGVIDNSPMGRLMVTMLLAFAEFERALIIERTQTGKAAARSRTGFRDGRPPKFSHEQIDHAIGLLETTATRSNKNDRNLTQHLATRESKKENIKMKKITVLDIKFYPHTVRWYRRKNSKQDSTQVSCF
ncbi:MAG: recombinase family protein [Gemmiger formicilis]|uniref:recombinase family protein n=1 Tax=Gemmiger formicilis TaxID=745368 RepID=UPI0039912DE4